MKNNIILDTDSYKASHWPQYPPGTSSMFSYLESRGGKYQQTLFFGLQIALKEYLSTPITVEMVEEAAQFFEAHGEPFNKEGWMYIAKDLKGKLPVRICAVPEGLVVPTHNILMSVESTDPKCFWVVSWLETLLMRVWYPITVATQSFHIKKLIRSYLEKSSDDPNAEINFKLHDFGSRGVSSRESAGIGGAAHLVNFMGSDTVVGVAFANHYYKHPMSGFSIPAAEHSTITMWGKEGEADAYANMIKQYAKPGSLVAVVSDSYDLYNAVENIWGKKLKDQVIESGATIVIRPDSGHPATVVLKTLELLDKQFGSSYNKKMFKVLNNVRVIQGDGINEESIREILETITKAGYSATNVAFGMGGALLQQVNRDTQKFAFKCSQATVNGKSIDVFKDPVTDHGKRSKRGKMQLVYHAGKFETAPGIDNFANVMKVVYENGVITKEYDLNQVRKLASEF
jgi:nicotinamide phosphoribosyltransferase